MSSMQFFEGNLAIDVFLWCKLKAKGVFFKQKAQDFNQILSQNRKPWTHSAFLIGFWKKYTIFAHLNDLP